MANLSSKIQGVSQAAMPVVTPWVSYTPTISGFSVTSIEGRWRRNGDSMEVRVQCLVSGTGSAQDAVIKIPSGYAINPDAITTVQRMAGSGAWYDSGVGFSTVAVEVRDAAQGELRFEKPGAPARIQGTDLALNDELGLWITVPIAGWESGTLQTANTYQVEYAYNSDTSDANDTTSFAYGAAGGQFGNFTALRQKTVRFRSEIQPSDLISLEVSYDGGTTWASIAEGNGAFEPQTSQNSVVYGIGWASSNSTDVIVTFGQYRRHYGATWGGAGTDWSGVTSSTYRYRIKKVSGGIQGFGNATTTTPGLVTLAQLCPVTDWTTFTPTITNLTLNATGKTDPVGLWRRVGANMELQIYFANGSGGAATGGSLLWNLPTGYTLDTSRLPSSGNGMSVLGYAQTYAVALAGQYDRALPLVYDQGGMMIGYPASSSRVAATDIKASGFISIFVTVPIREWAGSLPGLVSDAQVEFAYNDSASTISDTTSFATGTYGAQIQNFAPVGTASVTKRVRFANAVQATDEVVIEVQNGSGGWIPVSQSTFNFTTSDDGATYYGMALGQVSSTDFDVRFYSDPIPGAGWSALSAWSWRVKKVKSSISALVDNATATSYGLVKGGKVPGATDGVAIAAGYVGEVVEVTGATSAGQTSSANTWTDASAVGTLPLTAGRWQIGYSVALEVHNSSGAGTTIGGNVCLYDGASNVSGSVGTIWPYVPASGNVIGQVSQTVFVDLTSDATYSLKTRCASDSATGYAIVAGPNVSGALTDPDTCTRLWAVRIA